MLVTETSNTSDNARNNNNIGWKNLSILGGSNVVIAGVINIKQADMPASQNTVVISNPGLPGTVPCTGQGAVRIDLKAGLKTIWDNGGNKGEHLSLQNDGKIQLTMDNASIGDLSMPGNALYSLEVQYEPNEGARNCIIDLAQTNGEGKVIGGERFIYEPAAAEGAERNQLLGTSAVKEISVFPTIANDWLYVDFPDIEVGSEVVSILVIDAQGQLRLQQKTAISTNAPVPIHIASLPAGIFWVQIVGGETSWRPVKIIRI
jgi:hypothetical protein